MHKFRIATMMSCILSAYPMLNIGSRANANISSSGNGLHCVTSYSINSRKTGSYPKFQQLAAEASIVKVLGQSEPGTGVIIGKQGDLYLVLTAGHVLKDIGTSEELIVEDFEEESHKASARSIVNSKKYDLSIFEFRTKKRLPIQFFTRAVIKGSPESVRYRQDPIDIFQVSAGTIVAGHALLTPSSKKSFFRITDGKMVTRLSSAKADLGYDLVYTNSTVSGMSGGPVYLDRNDENSLLMLMGIHGRGEVADTSAGLVKTNFNFGISSYNAIDFIVEELPDFVNSHILSNVSTGKYSVYIPTSYSNYVKTNSGDHERCFEKRASTSTKSVTVNKKIKNGLNVTFDRAYLLLEGEVSSKLVKWTTDCFIGGSPEAVRVYRGYTIGTDPEKLYCEYTSKNPGATRGNPLDDTPTQLILRPSGNDPAPIDFSQIDIFTDNRYVTFPHR